MLKIQWSSYAKEEYAQILKYIESEYGLDSALKFMDSTDKILDTIALFPGTFPISEFEQIRKATISKQTSLFYRIKTNNVDLLHFWDNRQSEENLKDLFD